MRSSCRSHLQQHKIGVTYSNTKLFLLYPSQFHGLLQCPEPAWRLLFLPGQCWCPTTPFHALCRQLRSLPSWHLKTTLNIPFHSKWHLAPLPPHPPLSAAAGSLTHFYLPSPWNGAWVSYLLQRLRMQVVYGEGGPGRWWWFKLASCTDWKRPCLSWPHPTGPQALWLQQCLLWGTQHCQNGGAT